MKQKKTPYDQLVLKHSGIKVGYTQTDVEHNEGDTWEENGKNWCMKNGIKTSVSKLKDARLYGQLPLCCPNCGQRMEDNIQNQKSWLLRGYCFDCMIKNDNELVINGQFKQFEKEELIKNVKAQTKALKEELMEYLKEYQSNKYISDEGDIEEFQHDPDMVNKINIYCEQLEKNCEDIILKLNQ